MRLTFVPKNVIIFEVLFPILKMKSTSGAGAEAKEVGPGTLFCNKRTPSKSVNMYLSKSPPPLPGLVIVMCPLLLPREGGDPGTESVVIRVLLMLDSPSTRNLSPAP